MPEGLERVSSMWLHLAHRLSVTAYRFFFFWGLCVPQIGGVMNMMVELLEIRWYLVMHWHVPGSLSMTIRTIQITKYGFAPRYFLSPRLLVEYRMHMHCYLLHLVVCSLQTFGRIWIARSHRLSDTLPCYSDLYMVYYLWTWSITYIHGYICYGWRGVFKNTDTSLGVAEPNSISHLTSICFPSFFLPNLGIPAIQPSKTDPFPIWPDIHAHSAEPLRIHLLCFQVGS